MTTPPPPQVLPDAGKVQFLATTADSREDHPGVVYGAGHITDYVVEDKEFIVACYLDGKIALVEPLPPPVEQPAIKDWPDPPPGP